MIRNQGNLPVKHKRCSARHPEISSGWRFKDDSGKLCSFSVFLNFIWKFPGFLLVKCVFPFSDFEVSRQVRSAIQNISYERRNHYCLELSRSSGYAKRWQGLVWIINSNQMDSLHQKAKRTKLAFWRKLRSYRISGFCIQIHWLISKWRKWRTSYRPGFVSWSIYLTTEER